MSNINPYGIYERFRLLSLMQQHWNDYDLVLEKLIGARLLSEECNRKQAILTIKNQIELLKEIKANLNGHKQEG